MKVAEIENFLIKKYHNDFTFRGLFEHYASVWKQLNEYEKEGGKGRKGIELLQELFFTQDKIMFHLKVKRSLYLKFDTRLKDLATRFNEGVNYDLFQQNKRGNS